MGYKYYNQRDYGGNYDGGSFAECACGPTSCAMLAHKHKTKWNPKTVAAWLTKKGYATCGTEWGGITAFFNNNGMECKQYGGYVNQYGTKKGAAQNAWKKAMFAKGSSKTGILLMGKSRFTTGGHYIVIKGIKKQKDGTYLYNVYDPYSRGLCGWHKWSSFSGMVKQFYYIDVRYKSKNSTTSLGGFKCGKEYAAKSNRPIRANAKSIAKLLGTVPKGKKVKFSKLHRGTEFLWGFNGEGWLALKELDNGKTYFK